MCNPNWGLFKSKLSVDCPGRKRFLQPDHMSVLADSPTTHQPTVPLAGSSRVTQSHFKSHCFKYCISSLESNFQISFCHKRPKPQARRIKKYIRGRTSSCCTQTTHRDVFLRIVGLIQIPKHIPDREEKNWNRLLALRILYISPPVFTGAIFVIRRFESSLEHVSHSKCLSRYSCLNLVRTARLIFVCGPEWRAKFIKSKVIARC
jgi:hypothetical protein